MWWFYRLKTFVLWIPFLFKYFFSAFKWLAYFLFLVHPTLRKCEVCYKLKLVQTPVKVNDRTKAVTQHFLEKSFKKLLIKKSNKKTLKTQKIVYSGCLLRLGILRVLYCSVCWSLYGPFCHGILKLDISTMYTVQVHVLFCLTGFN